MGKKEINSICGERYDEFIEKSILIPSDMGIGFKFNLEKQGCKHLDKSFKCLIHKSEERPKICSDFPVFKAGDYYVFADICPAVESGLLNEYKKKFEKVGLKVV